MLRIQKILIIPNTSVYLTNYIAFSPPIIITQLAFETIIPVRFSWTLVWVAQQHIRASVVARIVCSCGQLDCAMASFTWLNYAEHSYPARRKTGKRLQNN